MFRIVGPNAKDLCDAHLRPTRRDLLRVGGAGMLGLSLGSLLKLQSAQAAGTSATAAAVGGGPGWGKAKSIIMVYLQGGPSHLDLWDPKEDVPDNVRSAFKTIATKIPGVQFTEILPKLAQVNDKLHDDPLDELHAERPVQPHGRHLPDDDRLHDRQGQPVRPARAAHAQGLPELRLATSSACKPPTSRCCPSSCCRGRCRRATSSARAAPPASWARPSIPTRSSPTATTWT